MPQNNVAVTAPRDEPNGRATSTKRSAPHADSRNVPGLKYDKLADEDSWQRLTKLLDQQLGSASSPEFKQLNKWVKGF